MNIFFAIHTLQIFDTALSILCQIKLRSYAMRVTVILGLTDYTEIRPPDFLLNLCARTADRIIVIKNSGYSSGMMAFFDALHVRSEILDAAPGASSADGTLTIAELVRKSFPQKTHFIRSHGNYSVTALNCIKAARNSGGLSIALLESLYPPEHSVPLSYLKSYTEFHTGLIDVFLANVPEHVEQLKTVGFKNYCVIGYTKFYPAWQEAIAGYVKEKGLEKDSGRKIISVFTRGENKCDRQQLMPHENLKLILEDIYNTVKVNFDDFLIYIKPHPFQDFSFLKELIRDWENTSLSFEFPPVLMQVSDLILTTFSTTALDAVAAGRFLIEYFIENDYFRSVYKHGSTFRQFGIKSCCDHDGFVKMLDEFKERGTRMEYKNFYDPRKGFSNLIFLLSS